MAIGTDIRQAAQLLRRGRLVAIPTETVYGLAANAFDAEAVLGIFEAKQRPAFDPLIVHVGDRAQVKDVVRDLPDEAQALMERFWPGPLTLVLPKAAQVPDIVTSGLDTVGIRMPAHPMALELLRGLPFPLAAPSANPFGYVSPTTAQHVADQLRDRVPYILDGGACAVGVESTIIGQENGEWVLYRPGGLAVDAIEAVIGRVGRAQQHVLPVAPGLLESHYAPHKPLHVGNVPELLRSFNDRRVAVISCSTIYQAWRCERLSPSGDMHEAARHLFAVLRALDASEAEVILAEVFPDEGLGAAINDRLRRASAKR
ncbi:MAG TPA: L-threonylcarbamoyladenylate synthase [Flavobacteriales bacterium]|jgi:L-threonylcarbamoyladenylate synthase|nr:L-threonylcarbamoyladenylate synthase [Flavobacteriales bacterium]